MTKRTFEINHSWVVAAIAIVALFGPLFLPYQLTMHSSGRLVLWPVLAFALGLMALWVWAWIESLKRKSIPAPLALVSLLVTAFPLYGLANNGAV